MNLIARNGHRKWPYGAGGRAIVVLVTTTLAWLGIQGQPAAARPNPARSGDLSDDGPPRQRGRGLPAAKIPLPRPRPEEAPAPPSSPAAEKPAVAPKSKPAEEQATPAPVVPQASACRLALTDEIAIAPSIPDIRGSGGCGGTDLVRLEAIVLANKHRVAVTPAATLRCSTASAIADWIRTDVAPLTEKLGSEISALDNFDSYECRGFNRVPGAHLSEHGRANALDVRAFRLADGREIGLTDRAVPRELRENVLHSVCTRFMTVLGPDSDGYHEDHIHLDLAERRNNYKICQWDVLDPLPRVAPLLPAERPEQAPPPEVAAKSDGDKDKANKARPEADKPQATDDTSTDDPPPRKKPTKKRR